MFRPAPWAVVAGICICTAAAHADDVIIKSLGEVLKENRALTDKQRDAVVARAKSVLSSTPSVGEDKRTFFRASFRQYPCLTSYTTKTPERFAVALDVFEYWMTGFVKAPALTKADRDALAKRWDHLESAVPEIVDAVAPGLPEDARRELSRHATEIVAAERPQLGLYLRDRYLLVPERRQSAQEIAAAMSREKQRFGFGDIDMQYEMNRLLMREQSNPRVVQTAFSNFYRTSGSSIGHAVLQVVSREFRQHSEWGEWMPPMQPALQARVDETEREINEEVRRDLEARIEADRRAEALREEQRKLEEKLPKPEPAADPAREPRQD
ncbi:MAG TPA: hypothetical protein VD997_07570 [Phycisphaerales bacterium]|nr:hypothetical protein [Phycisphaerales bacterium]